MMHEISIPYTVISSAARNLFRPLFPSSFAKPFTGSTAPTFSRYGVSHFSLSGTLPLIANEKDPSASLGMTLRKWRFPNISFIRDVGYLFPPYHHFERRREILLALCSSLPLSRKVSPFPLSHIRRYTGVQERSLDFARDDVAEAAFSQHILYTGRGLSIPPYRHFERSEKSFSSLFSMTPSLSLLREAPSPPFRDTMFPVPRCRTRSFLPPTKKIPRLRSG